MSLDDREWYRKAIAEKSRKKPVTKLRIKHASRAPQASHKTAVLAFIAGIALTYIAMKLMH